NVSLGPPSPTEFQAGMLRADQLAGELTLARRIRLPRLPALALSLGAAYRSDGFQIREGESDSWRYGGVLIPDGPHAGGLAQPGAQGYPAFTPADRVLARRDVVGGYGELSTVVRRRLTLGATGRLDFYPRLGNLAVY